MMLFQESLANLMSSSLISASCTARWRREGDRDKETERGVRKKESRNEEGSLTVVNGHHQKDDFFFGQAISVH
jgi:hypothetical protein